MILDQLEAEYRLWSSTAKAFLCQLHVLPSYLMLLSTLRHDNANRY
uniref:Uncharacterized protein n=1 Tax=Anguilla anguilla TaxID=7936 RepID=A0A0E9WJK2_ANGAN